ncbi:chromatin modification-related protein EAF7-domain-containing protein [Peziza echinospora]|nr:chromatin modification-related protein EAF7-domain-containing protein [Peziza echinospora]
MPPKKKTRVPSRARSVESDQAANTPSASATAQTTGSGSNPLVGEPVYSDGWTDEQEITLFKAIAVYRWKPAGMHKHFRMLAIEQMMRNHGVSDAHTNTEGIWKKLNSLYNLEGIDEREDMEDESDAPSWTEFKLPDEDFGELMASRRLNPEGTASPHHALDTKRWRRFSGSTQGAGEGGSKRGKSPSVGTVESTAGGDDSEDGSEVRSSPISQRSAPRKRGGRLSAVRGLSTPRGGRTTRGGGSSSTKKTPSTRKSKRGGDESSDGGEKGDDDDDEDDEEEEDESGNSDDESEPASTNASSPVSTPRGGGGRRGRGGGSAVKASRGGGSSRGKAGGADVRRSARKK